MKAKKSTTKKKKTMSYGKGGKKKMSYAKGGKMKKYSYKKKKK